MTGPQLELALEATPGSAPAPQSGRAPRRASLPEGGVHEVMQALLASLDRQLDEPPEVVSDWRGHTVWVFGAVGYRVDRRLRGVYPVHRDADGRETIGYHVVELNRPLATASFLPFVLRHLGLTGEGRQPESGAPPDFTRAEERISRDAYGRLLRDPRFLELRARRLPAALALDPELCRIAFLGRRTPGTRVASSHYSFAWRHERELRVAGRENPRLLPLLLAALDEGLILPCGDTVKELHLLFREEGLAPATWRYVARHGARFLRSLWVQLRRGHYARSAIEFLREIERAGHPAPPPAWFIEAWLNAAGEPHPRLDTGWNPVAPEVVGVCLAHARRVRGCREEREMVQDLPLALRWAATEAVHLDKRQRRAGWPWLVRRASAFERRRLLLEAAGPRTWPCAFNEVATEAFQATAVDCVEALVDEGIAFHNCIADYLAPCQEGSIRIFVVRERSGGRRAGVIRLDHQPFEDGWELHDVLGPANARVSMDLRRFAEDLALDYNVRMGGMPHEGGGWRCTFGDELARLEDDEHS